MSTNTSAPVKVQPGSVTYTENVFSIDEIVVDDVSLYFANDELLSKSELEFRNPTKLRNSVKEGSNKLDEFLRAIGSVTAPDAFLVNELPEHSFEPGSIRTCKDLLNKQFELLNTCDSAGLQWMDDIQHTYSPRIGNGMMREVSSPSRLTQPPADVETPSKEGPVEPETKRKKSSDKENEEINPDPLPKKIVTPLKIKLPPKVPMIDTTFMDAINAPEHRKIKKKKRIIISAANPASSNSVNLKNTEHYNQDLAPKNAIADEITVTQILSSISEEVALAANHVEPTVSSSVYDLANCPEKDNSSPATFDLEEPEPCSYSPGGVERLLNVWNDPFAELLEDPADECMETEEPSLMTGEQTAISSALLKIKKEVMDDNGSPRLQIKKEPMDHHYEKPYRRELDDDGDSDREDYRRPNAAANGGLYEEIVLSSDTEDEIESDDDEIEMVYQGPSTINKNSLDTPKARPLIKKAKATPASLRKVPESESREDKLKRIYKIMGMKEFETNRYVYEKYYTTAAEQMADNATKMTDTFAERMLQDKLARNPVGGWNHIPIYRAGDKISRLHYPFDQYSGSFWPVVQPFDDVKDLNNSQQVVKADLKQLSNMSCYSTESQKWFLCSSEPDRWDESFRMASKMDDHELKETGRFKHRIGYQKISKDIDFASARQRDAEHQAMERRFYETKDNDEIYVMTAEETKRMCQNELPCKSNNMTRHVEFNITDEYSSLANEGDNARNLTIPECWLSPSVDSLVSAHDKKWILPVYINDINKKMHRWMEKFDFPNTKHSVIIVRSGLQAAFAYQWRNRTCLCDPGAEERIKIKSRQRKLRNSFVNKMRGTNTIKLSDMLDQFRLLKYEASFWTIIWDSCVSNFRAYPSISFLLPLLQHHVDATFKSVVKIENRQRYYDEFIKNKKTLSVKWNIPQLEEERARKEEEAHHRALAEE